MGETLKFRNLTKDEIEVRVGANASLLLYKTARVDANMLDETVGCFNWQKRFYQVKNTMICEISINMNYNNPSKEPLWVSKADGGDDDYTMEKVKAECSDSMKRAAFQWGIGRNLYTAPKIKLDDQFKGKQYFDVESIGYNDKGVITDLVISTDFGKTIVFSYKNGKKVPTSGNNTPKNTYTNPVNPLVGSNDPLAKSKIDETDLVYIQRYIDNLPNDYKRQEFFRWLDVNFETTHLALLTLAQGRSVVASIKKKESER